MTDDNKRNDQQVDQPADEVTATTTAVTEESTTTLEAAAPRAAAPPEQAEDDPHATLAAYLLDALDEDERAAFAAHLATCEVCQEEARTLAPIVGTLPVLLHLDPAVDVQSAELADLPADFEPSPELRLRIVAAIRAETAPEIAAPEQAIEVAPEAPASAEPEEVETGPAAQAPAALAPTPIAIARRPRGRIRPGVTTGPPTMTSQAWQTFSRVSWASRIAVLLALVAVGAIIWALALQGRVDDLKNENDAQATEIAAAQNNSNATVAQLNPTADGKQDSQGRLLYSLPDRQGWVVLEGMKPPPADQAYQVWYLKDGAPAPAPGPVIAVDHNGNGLAKVAPDTPTYDGLALTVEPKGGSEAPTSPIVLQGRLSGAAG